MKQTPLSERERSYSRAEYRADRLVHLAGITVAPFAVAFLILRALSTGSARQMIGAAVYGAALLSMLGCSALYNLSPNSPARDLYRRLDRAAIYAMIAGTYTPVTLTWLPAHWGWVFCASVWWIAAAGIAIVVAYPRRFERLSVALYLVLGWSILTVIKPLLILLPTGAGVLLLLGGVLYSAGVVFHLRRTLPYHTVLWHICVLLAVACQFAAIIGWIGGAYGVAS